MPIRSLPVLREVLSCGSYLLPGLRDRELLRMAVDDLLPPDIRTRDKIRGDPQRLYGPVARAAAALLNQEDLQIEQRGLVNPAVMRGLARHAVNGRLEGSQDITLLRCALTLETWLRSHPLVGSVELISS